MQDRERTQEGAMRVRRGLLSAGNAETQEGAARIEWKAEPKRHAGERLMRNLAVASALVLCAVTLRAGALPQLSSAADAVLTAATDDSLLDDQLGRLSFVSAMFPEAVLVFGESRSGEISMPVSGGVVVHAWSQAEPYMSWQTESRVVTSAADGEVIGVYHGNGEERLVQVMGEDGLSCLYGNLEEISVQAGDAVCAGDPIGTLMTGAEAVFEVRQDGLSIDPALFWGQL